MVVWTRFSLFYTLLHTISLWWILGAHYDSGLHPLFLPSHCDRPAMHLEHVYLRPAVDGPATLFTSTKFRWTPLGEPGYVYRLLNYRFVRFLLDLPLQSLFSYLPPLPHTSQFALQCMDLPSFRLALGFIDITTRWPFALLPPHTFLVAGCLPAIGRVHAFISGLVTTPVAA